METLPIVTSALRYWLAYLLAISVTLAGVRIIEAAMSTATSRASSDATLQRAIFAALLQTLLIGSGQRLL